MFTLTFIGPSHFRYLLSFLRAAHFMRPAFCSGAKNPSFRCLAHARFMRLALVTSPPPESPHSTDTPPSSRFSASPSDNPQPSPQKYSARTSADSGRSLETTYSA